MKKIAASLLVLAIIAGLTACTQSQTRGESPSQVDVSAPDTAAQENGSEPQVETPQNQEDAVTEKQYTFELAENVTRTQVTYRNRYGITLVADLYTPDDLDNAGQYPALVIGPPYAAIKEQVPGHYANELAQRGFVALAIDPVYNGDNGGEPRHVSSPDLFVEDFSAGVDYLGSLSYVDREKIGAIGVCGSGSFAISAAQVDTRIKAVASASMYDISRNIRNGLFDSMSDEDRAQMLDQLSRQRWADFENGQPEFFAPFPAEPADEMPEGADPVMAEFFSYYGTARGHHPDAHGNFTTTSSMAFMNFPLLSHIDSISPRPILFIVGGGGSPFPLFQRGHLRAGGRSQGAVYRAGRQPCGPVRRRRRGLHSLRQAGGIL